MSIEKGFRKDSSRSAAPLSFRLRAADCILDLLGASGIHASASDVLQRHLARSDNLCTLSRRDGRRGYHLSTSLNRRSSGLVPALYSGPVQIHGEATFAAETGQRKVGMNYALSQNLATKKRKSVSFYAGSLPRRYYH